MNEKENKVIENSDQQVLSAVEYEMDQIGAGDMPEEVKEEQKESE